MSNKPMHTPGPWSASEEGWLDGHIDINAPSHGAIALVLAEMEEQIDDRDGSAAKNRAELKANARGEL